MSGARKLMDAREGVYSSLKARASLPGTLPAAVAEQIELDLRRTYPDHVLWLPDRPHTATSILSDAASLAKSSGEWGGDGQSSGACGSSDFDEFSECGTATATASGSAGGATGSAASVDGNAGQSVGVQLLRSLLSAYALYDTEARTMPPLLPLQPEKLAPTPTPAPSSHDAATVGPPAHACPRGNGACPRGAGALLPSDELRRGRSPDVRLGGAGVLALRAAHVRPRLQADVYAEAAAPCRRARGPAHTIYEDEERASSTIEARSPR